MGERVACRSTFLLVQVCAVRELRYRVLGVQSARSTVVGQSKYLRAMSTTQMLMAMSIVRFLFLWTPEQKTSSPPLMFGFVTFLLRTRPACLLSMLLVRIVLRVVVISRAPCLVILLLFLLFFLFGFGWF